MGIATFRYETVVGRDLVPSSPTDIPINCNANTYQVTIITKSKGNPPSIPATDNIKGSFTFEVRPYFEAGLEASFEDLYTDSSASIVETIDVTKQTRSFLISGFFLECLRVTPHNITNPYTVVIQQEDR